MPEDQIDNLKEEAKEAIKGKVEQELAKKFWTSPVGGYTLVGLVIGLAAAFIVLFGLVAIMQFRKDKVTDISEGKTELNEKILENIENYEFQHITSRMIQRTIIIVVEQINTYNTGEADDPEDVKTLALNSLAVKNFVPKIVAEYKILDEKIDENTTLDYIFDEIAYCNTVHDFMKKEGIKEIAMDEYQSAIAEWLSLDIEDVYDNIDEEEKYFYEGYYDLKAINLISNPELLAAFVGTEALTYTPLEIKNNFENKEMEAFSKEKVLNTLIDKDPMIIYAPGVTIDQNKDYFLLVGYTEALEFIFYNSDLTESTELISDFYPKIENIWVIN